MEILRATETWQQAAAYYVRIQAMVKGLMWLIILKKRCNRNHIYDYKNLWGYARDLYQTPGFGDTTDFEAIKKGYFDGTSPYGIIPKGPDLAKWNTPHGREHLSKTPGKNLRNGIK